MSLANIRAEYKSILSGVTTVGVVHDYERWSVDWSKFLVQFKDAATGKIKGWTITREKTIEAFTSGPGAERKHAFVIRGYLALDDTAGSEKTFQDLVETVCDTFRPKTTLNGKVEQVEAPLQVDLVEVRLFGAVLCHYCELRQTVEELLTFTES